MAGPGVVPLENRILVLACGFVVRSRGLVVFVDQAIQYGFSADSLGIEVGWGVAQDFALTAGNPLVDALMRLAMLQWPGIRPGRRADALR
jgi:hypothetical protein